MASVAPVAAKGLQLLGLRHGRGAPGGAGEDEALGDFREGEFASQSRCGCGEGGHARGEIV